MKPQDLVYVTKPSLPPLSDFIPYLERIWNSRVLTNGGIFHQELEAALCSYLGVPYVSLFNNGTIALITALQALGITGEVITTPYSFVATSHALVWNNLKPVFVDINEKTLNIDPQGIESAITSSTTAILAVHCYGQPCDVDAIKHVADKFGLQVIYDAAHAFGVNCHCGSVLKHGDLSVLSFHATKVFNTFEGGAIVSNNEKTKMQIDLLKNFGFVDEVTVAAVGINGKMSEFNAALGLAQLKSIDESIARRREVYVHYRSRLSSVAGLSFPGDEWLIGNNFGYFPILVDTSYPLSRDQLYDHMRSHGIYVRRYFYPLISDMPMYRELPSASPDNLRVASAAASRVLCLPIYDGLRIEDQNRICDLITLCSHA